MITVIESHEQRHDEQWTSISPYSQLFQPSEVFELFDGESITSSDPTVLNTWVTALQKEARLVFLDYLYECDTFVANTYDCREQDAHGLSNGVGPAFLKVDLSQFYQNCPSTMPPVPNPTR